jgi:hypothetical protein
LVFGDFRRRVAHLAIERLASYNALQDPSREQILFRVGGVAAKDTGPHGVKSSTLERLPRSAPKLPSETGNSHPTASKTQRFYGEFLRWEARKANCINRVSGAAMGIEPTPEAWDAAGRIRLFHAATGRHNRMSERFNRPGASSAHKPATHQVTFLKSSNSAYKPSGSTIHMFLGNSESVLVLSY